MDLLTKHIAVVMLIFSIVAPARAEQMCAFLARVEVTKNDFSSFRDKRIDNISWSSQLVADELPCKIIMVDQTLAMNCSSTYFSLDQKGAAEAAFSKAAAAASACPLKFRKQSHERGNTKIAFFLSQSGFAFFIELSRKPDLTKADAPWSWLVQLVSFEIR